MVSGSREHNGPEQSSTVLAQFMKRLDGFQDRQMNMVELVEPRTS